MVELTEKHKKLLSLFSISANISEWKSNRLSSEIFNTSITSIKSLSPALSYVGHKIRVKRVLNLFKTK